MTQTIYCLYHHNIPGRQADTVQVMKMAQGFRRLGHRVILLSPQSRHNSIHPNDLWVQYGIHEPFEVKTWQPLPFIRGHDIALRSLIFMLIHERGIVYGRNLVASMWSSLMGIPTIFDSHGPPEKRMGHLYYKAMFSGSGFRRLLVITTPLRNTYLQAYPRLKKDQILVDPNGFDAEQFDNLPKSHTARKELNLPQQYTIGYIGHMYPGRGLNLILTLAEELDLLQFLLVGGMPDDIKYWNQQIAARKIKNITMLGFVEHSKLIAYYAACDVLLMPYQNKVTMQGGKGESSSYMSPMKMFEYMASGRLTIASDHPVLREVLNDENAVILSPNDIKSWKNAILKASQNSKWATAIALKAQQDVKNHTWMLRAKRALEGISL